MIRQSTRRHGRRRHVLQELLQEPKSNEDRDHHLRPWRHLLVQHRPTHRARMPPRASAKIDLETEARRSAERDRNALVRGLLTGFELAKGQCSTVTVDLPLGWHLSASCKESVDVSAAWPEHTDFSRARSLFPSKIRASHGARLRITVIAGGRSGCTGDPRDGVVYGAAARWHRDQLVAAPQRRPPRAPRGA